MRRDPPPPSTALASLSWVWLVLALAWVALTRVPLVLNAGAHLDSDLAVDGLTLLDAVNGHWRWHYPGTPFIGSAPVLLSWPQAMVWGVNPITLVSGGVVAYGLVVLLTYVLNRRAFGPSVASWGLVPLAFASTGTLWLSGRVTGGHLLTVAWHAGAFALLWEALTKGGWWRSAALGLWCGVGLYLDSMFAATWLGLVVAMCVSASLSPRAKAGMRATELMDLQATSQGNRIISGFACLLAFFVASAVGVAPRLIGARIDPHDSYRGQFQPDIRVDRLTGNARIMLADCLPRLIAGHRLPGLQAEPRPPTLKAGSRASTGEGVQWMVLALTNLSLYLFVGAMVAILVVDRAERESNSQMPARVAIRWGLLASSLAVVGGFLVNRTIVNSDNYRYLVFLLVPWSTGFGLMIARMTSKRPSAFWVGGALTVAFAGLMTVDTTRWYARFGWVDRAGLPVRKVVEDPALAWLDAHPEVPAIFGDYWDVYRLSFLTGGRVKGVPFPEYPDRFPEIRQRLPGERPRIVIVGPDGFGPLYRARALVQGGREIGRAEGLSVVDWPVRMTP